MSELEKRFHRYKDSKIAVYGLGAETERVLEEIGQKFQIIGLLDGYRDTGDLFGRPIISMEQAIDAGVKLILVAARPGSCKAIAKRIGSLCVEKQIDLFDVRGKNLCKIQKSVYDFSGQAGMTKQELWREIEGADVVSFDLFDTLLMRQVLFPADVFELVDDRLRQRGILLEGFSEKRMRSEKELSKYRAPTLTEIYSFMKETYDLSDLKPEETALLEWQTDCELIVPRKEVCEILETAKKMGKRVYVVSDSYYSRDQIIGLLERCKIRKDLDVFVSCEYGTGKTQELFERFKEVAQGKSYLHVGDDIVADVESAQRNGIKAVQLYSGMELLELCGYMGLWDDMDSLSARIKIGMFVANLFNSPFQFETEEKRIKVYRAFDMVYLFFAPVICDFVIWLYRQVKKEKLETIFFCARDGYLMKRLYDELGTNIKSVYFLTSRTAAIGAGMETEADLGYVEKMKFSGNLKEHLWQRFGIEIKESEDVGGGSARLSDYSREILEAAVKKRRGYKAYISSLKLNTGEIAFFDFVAKGTSQMYLGRLVPNHLKGFYFLQLDRREMEKYELDIVPFYKEEERESSIIFDDYYILETLLTAPTASVTGFEENGQPVYGKETRSRENIACFEEAQEGIWKYFTTYLAICPKEKMKTEKRLDEIFLSLLHQMEILEKRFLDLKVEDPFFNRTTEVMDLV